MFGSRERKSKFACNSINGARIQNAHDTYHRFDILDRLPITCIAMPVTSFA